MLVETVATIVQTPSASTVTHLKRRDAFKAFGSLFSRERGYSIPSQTRMFRRGRTPWGMREDVGNEGPWTATGSD